MSPVGTKRTWVALQKKSVVEAKSDTPIHNI
jgi:hypothetical protein